MEKKAILITGASSGIGFEFAHVFCEKTVLPMILVARRLDRLEKLKEVLLKKYGDREIFCISKDLRSQTERSSLVNEVHGNGHFVQTLVNNAGYGSYGYFSNSRLDWELDMIRLNCEAVIELSHSFLPDMLTHNSGAIINVSSMASFQGLPFLSTYAATKAFVTSFSLALAAEVKGTGIKIQALCPGPVATEFIDVAGFPDKISVLPSLSARQVAELSVKKLSKGQRLMIPGWMNFFLSQLNRLFPRATASDIARMVLSNKFKL
jgi:short-subunit dehydrogenase